MHDFDRRIVPRSERHDPTRCIPTSSQRHSPFGFLRRSPDARMNSMVLEQPSAVKKAVKPDLELASPPPPPPSDIDGGGNGDSGKWPSNLRLLGPPEQVAVLNDWISQCSIYGMSDKRSTQEAHSKAIETLKALLAFEPSVEIRGGVEILLALYDGYDENSISAVAGVNVICSGTRMLSVDNMFVVERLAIKPMEVHKERSEVGPRMLHAMRSGAGALGLILETAPLHVYGEWPTGMEW